MSIDLKLARTAEVPAPRKTSWPRYEADEVEAVAEVLRSGHVNSLHHGKICRRFESEMAELCEMPHAIAVTNGTAALELALKALGVGVGDEVIVPARSFMASASCVVTCGASPIFADVDRDSQNITADTIAAVLSPRTKAVIVVHLAGWPCDMEPIVALAQKHGLLIIEDCAQSPGAFHNGRPTGSFGDAAGFSFCTDKIISTGGEGGMLLLRDRSAWKRAWALKDHGKDPDNYAAVVPGPDFLWLHDSVGSNYRMTEMQAAIGSIQLGKLPRWLAARRANVAALESELTGLKALRLAIPSQHTDHARYKYCAFVRPEHLKAGWDRRRIIQEAVSQGLSCTTGSCPEIYREAAFADYPLRPASRFPVAQELGETSIMLTVDHTLSQEDMSAVGKRLRKIIELATA